ncbi:protein ecdysoneless homolog [Centruroides sculpturatus]|uniref:protein ecdysoneless homolog n=1 Tax=Centruroides sculpturatus TaxID=218467 RepID=UPI000C6CD33D|nr:protein ecdysoneless homolog [Centruroides sculpturatus]
MASSIHEVEEDCVKYWLFPNLSASRDDLTRKHLLERYLEEYIANLGPYLINYIWQNEPFRLSIVHNDTEEMPAHLEGSTKFGDNIEDEWFIVFLLMQLTKEDEHLVVKVKDNDGEFLLIEAAESLPKWLNPDTSENRVYIYRQNINIISSTQVPAQSSVPTEKPKISDCIKAVVSTSCPTKASQAIQQAIKYRIKGYVINFITDLSACRVMKYFPPETRVMAQVTFTRCLYAQLIQQQYSPDRRVGWNMPSPTSPDFKSHDLGMKLACGFEILVANTEQSSKINLTLPEDVDFSGDNRWMRYLQTLTDKGYFRGELEGSLLYQKLLKEAKYFYCENFVKTSKNDFLTPGAKILHLLETLSINYEELKEEEKMLKPPDDDSWLEIKPEELDKLLSEYSKRSECKRNSLSGNEKQLTETITESLKSFIYHKSDFEGAEIPKSRSQKKESFDPEHFTDPMNSILDFHVPDSDHSSSSEMSGYSDEDDGMDFSDESMNILIT